MATTQHRPHSALSGRRFASFAGKSEETETSGHPVGILLQHRPHGTLSGRRYGSFAGKPPDAGSPHPVGILTQHRPHSALGGRRYGSFAGKPGPGLNEWFLAGVEELEFVGELSASGDFELGHLVEQEGSVELVGVFSASGDFVFAAPVAPTPGSRFIGPRVGLRANGELIILF